MARTKLYPASVDPGFPELSPTPAGWVRVTFGDALELVERPIKLEANSRYKLLTAKRSRGGITLRGELLGREVLTKTQFRVKSGDFVISRRQIIHGACGTVQPDLDDAVVSNEYSALRTKPGLLMDFFRHYSHTPYFQRTCFHSSHGVDVEKMIFKIDEWLKRQVDLPPLTEQRKIAAILSSVDEVIERTEGVIEQLQVVKKAMMQELLTRGLPGRHVRFKKTEIGAIPEEWVVQSIEEVAQISSGSTPSRRRADFFSTAHGVPWVKTGDLTDRAVLSTEEQLTDVAISEARVRIQDPGTVMVAMYGGFAQIGRTGVLGTRAATNQAICCLSLNGSVTPEYVNAWLVANRWRWQTIAASSRKDPNIRKQDVATFPIAVPSKDEQSRISEIAQAIARRVEDETVTLQKCRELKSALMPVLLTGELRVSTDRDAA